MLACNNYQLFMGFTGKPSGRHFQEMEVIQYRPEARGFDFKRIAFSPLGARFDESPADCVSCHHGRPNWQNYFIWRGVYGSRDDFMPRETEFDDESLKRNYPRAGNKLFHNVFESDPAKIVEELLAERRGFETYVRGVPGGRYQFLARDEGSPISPFAPEAGYADYGVRTNFRLGIGLFALNTERMSGQLRASTYFGKYRYLLAWSLLCPTGEFPPGVKDRLAMDLEGVGLEPPDFSEREAVTLQLFQLMGATIAGWSTTFVLPESFSEVLGQNAGGRRSTSTMVSRHFLDDLAQTDPLLKALWREAGAFRADPHDDPEDPYWGLRWKGYEFLARLGNPPFDRERAEGIACDYIARKAAEAD